MADTVPAVVARTLMGWEADSLALAAERRLEVTLGLKFDANSRRNKLHRLDGAPCGDWQEMFAHSIAAQQ